MTNSLRSSTLQTVYRYVVNDKAIRQYSTDDEKAVLSYDPIGQAARLSVNTLVVAARGMCSAFATATVHPVKLQSHQVVTNDALFQQYIQAWHSERGAASSISEMVLCKSHMRIIAMGAEIAIPLILRKMADEGNEPDMWFVALQTLTGADPVTDEIRGEVKAMADRWLQWAADNGYAW